MPPAKSSNLSVGKAWPSLPGLLSFTSVKVAGGSAVIRVDPPLMKQSSQAIKGVGSNTGSVGNKLSGTAARAPSYDGQFGPRVRSIADAAASRAKDIAGRVGNLGGWLNSKTDAFIAVDTASQAGVRSLAVPVSSSGQSSMLLQLSKWLGIPVSLIEKYLKLGGLFGFGSLLSSIAISFILKSHYGPSWQGRTYKGMTASAFVSDTASRFKNWVAGKGWKTDLELEAARRAEEAKKKPKSPQQPKPASLEIGMKQNDPTWTTDPMGDNNMTIGEVGCLITAVSMVGRYYGANITPKDVNEWLRSNSGYAPGSSNLIWGRADAYLDSVLGNKRNFADVSATTESINSQLKASRPTILHVPGPRREDGHWVLAVKPGSRDGTFIAFDPWTGKQAEFAIERVKGAKTY